MSEPLTAVQCDEMRAEHGPSPAPNPVCRGCDEDWPCDRGRLLTTIEARDRELHAVVELLHASVEQVAQLRDWRSSVTVAVAGPDSGGLHYDDVADAAEALRQERDLWRDRYERLARHHGVRHGCDMGEHLVDPDPEP